MSPKKHDWATRQSYLNAHERVLRTYEKWMDHPHSYKHTQVTAEYLLLQCHGIIFTSYQGNKVRVDITKDVEIDTSNPKRLLARTFGYSYNAVEQRTGNRIRYDSPDSVFTPATPYHHRFHHKHVEQNGKETITRVPNDEWPHVDEFFREVLSAF